jgi:hypothetical protein
VFESVVFGVEVAFSIEKFETVNLKDLRQLRAHSWLDLFTIVMME